jgi:Outer membrane protein and related peptidoglycan-associated (lipo)proteins
VGGALVGTMVGSYMEEQKRDFERQLAPEIAGGVIRVQKLPDNQLLVGMTSATAFEVDSDRIQPSFYSTLDKISAIVRKYGKTQLAVSGHTDSTGSAAYNQTLSERRAASVGYYLERSGVLPQRIYLSGYGMNQPIASNATEQGRRLNRRVDIVIIAITGGDGNQKRGLGRVFRGCVRGSAGSLVVSRALTLIRLIPEYIDDAEGQRQEDAEYPGEVPHGLFLDESTDDLNLSPEHRWGSATGKGAQ